MVLLVVVGAVRAPIASLLADRVRYAIVIDRMTTGKRAPQRAGKCVRHVVGTYKGVALHDHDCWPEMIAMLRRAVVAVEGALPPPDEAGGAGEAAEDAGAAEALPVIESPNCADAIEWRGRWDAVIVAPRLLEQAGAASSAAQRPGLRAALER